MWIAEWMTDFIGVVRKERKEVKWPSKDSDGAGSGSGWH